MTADVATAAMDLSDPAWYPADLDVRGDAYSMLKIDLGVVERSTFMDTRLEADFSKARRVARAEVAAAGLASPAPAWLLHTSFCCSTLLARALHHAPDVVVYREPLALRRLADARHLGSDIVPWLHPTVQLLARPWSRSGATIIKPTHAALNIAGDLLATAPSARTIVLTSSLVDFLVSNLKKTQETQARIPELAARALQAGSLRHRLPQEAFNPPTLIAAAGLQWAAQRDLLVDITKAQGGDRIRVLDQDGLLADLPGTTKRCLDWWGIAVDEARVRRRAEAVSSRHAKAATRPYDARVREAEAAALSRAFAAELTQARAWLDKWVLPALAEDAQTMASGPNGLLR